MCGIAGIVNADLSAEAIRRGLERMCAAMVHRGPDEQGVAVFPAQRSGLGARRLSLVDLEHGSQPVRNEDGSIQAVLNGEIYNHVSLRDELVRRGHRFRSSCDSEVIPHLYQEYGDEFLSRLEGMYGIAVLDLQRGRLLLARDRAGMKPLYWSRCAGGVAFASEVRALLASGVVRAEPDPEALDVALGLGWIPAPRTGFKNIEKLPAGGCLVFEGGKLHRRQHWRLRYTATDHHDIGRSADDLEKVLGDAVASHLKADVPVGVFVSGGIDSSLVAAFAAERTSGPLRTFSIVFPDHPELDESRYSRLVAQSLGADHHEVEFRAGQLPELLPAVTRHIEEPASATPGVLTHLLAGLAGAKVKAVVGGEGSDELFAGYGWTQRQRLYRLRRFTPSAVARFAARHLKHPSRRNSALAIAAPDEAAADLERFRRFSPDEKRRLLAREWQVAGPDLGAGRVPDETLATCTDRLQRRLALDFTGRLADSILLKNDKIAMAHSLEVRMPFLDNSVIDFARSLPSHARVNQGREKYVLSLVAARKLPKEIAERHKLGLRYPTGCLADPTFTRFARELLLDHAARGPFDRGRLESVLEGWLHPSEASRHFTRVLSLVVLQCWWNAFFTGTPEHAVSAPSPVSA